MKGLITPIKFFSRISKANLEKLLTRKFGTPKSIRKFEKTWYNQKTCISYNLHHEPGHQGDKPHVDIKARKWKEKNIYLLKH